MATPLYPSKRMRSFATLRRRGEQCHRANLRHARQAARRASVQAHHTTGFLERAVAHVMALDRSPTSSSPRATWSTAASPRNTRCCADCSRHCRCRSISSPATTMRAMPCARPSRSRLPAEDRLPAVHDRGPAGAPDRARHAGAGQGPRRAVRRAAGWLEARLGESDRPTALFMHHPPFDCGIDAFDGMKLKRRRAAGRDRPPPQPCRARDVRPRPSADPGAVGRHHGLDRALDAHQATLDLHETTPHSLMMEPPGLALHLWRPGMVS